MKSTDLIIEPSSTNDDLLNLDRFKNKSISDLNKYLKSKGFINRSCMNDYKWAWIKPQSRRSVVATIEFVDDVELDNEIVVDVRQFNGIYREQ